jgi:hypothetical protein
MLFTLPTTHYRLPTITYTLYPIPYNIYIAGATTNSQFGVTDVGKIDDVLMAMAEIGMPLLLHGYVVCVCVCVCVYVCMYVCVCV